MASIKFELEAEVRADKGKGASRRLRHTNKVPAVVYGAGEPAVSLILNHDKVINALANEAFYSRILTLSIAKKDEKVILKAVQRHPAKPRVQHMDFLRIRADQKLHMHIPLHFIGEDKAPGLKEGGVFSHNINDVEISCLPANLPEYIEIDVSNMILNQTIHLSELKLPQDVTLVAFSHGVEGHDLPVVSLHIPRIIEEEPIAAPAAETPEAGAEAGATEQKAAGEAEDKKEKKEKKE